MRWTAGLAVVAVLLFRDAEGGQQLQRDLAVAATPAPQLPQ